MEHPFKTEYARSSRSKCSVCHIMIQEGNLRMGTIILLDCADKNSIKWYCVECFFGNELDFLIPTDTFDIEHFEQLRWNDQKIIKDKMKSKIFDKNNSAIKYLCEKSTCTRCARDICKNEVVFSNNAMNILICLKCFGRSALKEFLTAHEEMEGFHKLKEADQHAVRKINLNNTDENIINIKQQNEVIYNFYDRFYNSETEDLLTIFKENELTMETKGKYDILERLSHILTFGIFLCKYCGSDKNYTLTKFGYRCNSDFYYTYTETSNKKRDKIEIESSCLGVNQYYNRRPTFIKISNNPLEYVTTFYTPALKFYPPLYNMKFFIGIQPVRGKEVMEEKITQYGGIVVHQIQEDTTAVISNDSDIRESKEYVNTARRNNAYVISEDFIDESFDVYGGANFIITSKMLTNWGVNPDLRENLNRYPLFKDMTGIIKNGLDIERLSGLEQSAHIYQENTDIYAKYLIKANVQDNCNSYYKLQLLESDKEPRRYTFFCMWGRIGTNKGSNISTECSLDEGKRLFEKKYKAKTGKVALFDKTFSKEENKYTEANIVLGHHPIQIRGEVFEDSSLHSAVKELLKFIFNKELVNKTVMEYSFNTEIMPLGKLQNSAFKRGYKLLKQIRKVLKEKEENWSFKIGCLTHEFYKQIPQNFGTAQLQLINNFIVLQEKEIMLKELENAEFIYNIIHSSNNKNIDNYYEQLQADIQVVAESSDEYKTIQKYLINGHGRTHRYKLSMQNVYKVQRLVENNNCALHNHKLLWHGSRRVNFASIIAKGLMIHPVEASFQGAMFGEGIYFADVATKSARYCDVQMYDEDNRGLLLLCDVALGEIHEVTESTNNRAGKDSIKALGRNIPSSVIFDDFGVEIPIGELQEIDINSALIYNEYVVFNPDQVKIRYIVAVNIIYELECTT